MAEADLALYSGALDTLGTSQVDQTQPGLAQDLLVLPGGHLDALHGIGIRVCLLCLEGRGLQGYGLLKRSQGKGKGDGTIFTGKPICCEP